MTASSSLIQESGGEAFPEKPAHARSLALDILKCALAVAVVAIHSSPLITVSAGLNFVLINGLCRIAVPTFLVINGFYFVAALRDSASFAKWWARMAKLYVFWMIVYTPLYLLPQSGGVLTTLKTLTFGYLQLWYIAALVVAGPMLFWLHDKVSRGKLFGIAFSLFGAGVAMQYYSYFLTSTEHYTLYRNALLFALPFLTLGYLLRAGFFDRVSQAWHWLLFVIGLAGLALEIALAYTSGRFDAGFDMYASLILVCPLVLDRIRRSRTTYNSDDIGTLSAVIYFLHPWGIRLMLGLVHHSRGPDVFLGAMLFCLAMFYPLRALARRWTFVL